MDDTPALEDCIVAALRRIVRAVDLHSRRLVETCGLTGPQLATLREAARLSPVSTTALARAVHLSNPTMTGILSRLEARGLVERTRGEVDRRTVTVRVTDDGRALLARTPSLLQDRLRDRLSRLSRAERGETLAALEHFARMMGAEDLDATTQLVSREDSLAAPDGRTSLLGT